MKRFMALSLAALALAGCATIPQDSEITPGPTVTVTATPTPEVTPDVVAEDTPEPRNTNNDDMMFFLAIFDAAWEDMSSTDQMDLCAAYDILGLEYSYNEFKDGFGVDFDPRWLEEAFLTHCGI